MNAPRQGFFASILTISFILHIVLILQNSLQYQSIARDSQGSLFLQQLSEEAKVSLANKDTVSLALLAQRYGERQNIALIQILDAKGKLLAQGGTAPTRLGKTFTQTMTLDDKDIGKIDITLFMLNRGEVLRSQWIFFVGSFFIHCLLWFMYKRVARPERHLLDLYMINAQEHVFESQPLHPHTTGNRIDPNAVPFSTGAVFEPQAEQAVHDITSIHTKNTYKTILQVQFNDPNHLLETLSPSVELPYYQLNQTLLEKAIETLNSIHSQSQLFIKAAVLKGFDKHGAQVGIDGRTLDVLEYATQLGLLFNLLSESVYQHHKQNSRFALFTRVGIAESTNSHVSPSAIAKQILGKTEKNTVAIHCQNQFTDKLRRSFVLYKIPELLTTKDCEAFLIYRVSDEGVQETLSRARDRILDSTQ